MTSIIKLQAFSGVQDEGPLCYMLQVDEFRFLLDCGWDEDFRMSTIESLKKHAHQIDAVLLTYPDSSHLGALPYMVGRCGLNCPIYATVPVYKMGQMFMYDLYQSRHNTEDFNLFTLDDVDAAFDKIIQLKYSQTVGLKGKGHGLQITPLPGGHMIGGTIWKIVKDGEEEIVYAVDYNHKKERHLNGCMLENIMRPSLLITDSYNATYVQARRKLRDEQLMTSIVQTVRASGNALVVVDTAGRVLELAQLLDQVWRKAESGLMAYSLALLNNVSYNVVEFAKSQVEWMSDKIMRAFEDRRNNPFQFKHLQLCHSLAELAKVPDPKVVLASVPDMQCGFSRDLFLSWCGNPNNSIILTSRSSQGTLARNLIENTNQKSINLEIRRRVRLDGAELEEYMRKQKEKEMETARQADLAKKEMEDMESSDESEAEMDVDGPNISSGKARHDLMMKGEGKGRTGFFKQAKKAYPMFPMVEDRIKWDDYGEIIKPEDYTVLDFVAPEEEKMDTSAPVDDPMQDISEVPTKCIASLKTVDINANIVFIDFEGRSDGESIKKLLSQIKPRQVILVHGNRDSTQSLAEYCRSSAIVSGKVFTPKLNEVVNVTTESRIYQVRMSDALVSSLQFSKAKDAELAWLDALLDLSVAKTDTSAKHDLEEKELDENGMKIGASQQSDVLRDEESGDIVPTLVKLPAYQKPGHMSVFINEPKLSDFKQVLVREGIQAEFSAGVLICNNSVAVRRNEAGRIQLEGCLSDDYYRVRELLYAQYAII